jgi:hypothetical protein
LQTNGAPHTLPGQQRSPLPPQVAQKSPPEQVVHGAVQSVPPQQVSATPPQVPQLPAEQVPLPLPQSLPDATHIWASRGPTQQPPASQLSPSQQGCPAPPQVWHWPPRVQTVPPATQ